MKKNIILKLILIIGIAVLQTNLLTASMTKMYIGNENDQLIVGIESFTANVDGGGGLEIRTYFRKNGIVVNGDEYGSIPGKTKYTLLLAGKNEEGSILKLRKNFIFTANEYTNSYEYSGNFQTELGAGKGIYILYQ